MPELPEVEITARRLHAALQGATVESALTPGINTLKTFDPPLFGLHGQPISAIRRRGKLFVIDVGDELSLLIHLMSAGRLQLYPKRAGLRDKSSRLLLRLPSDEEPERELRLREFGTKQAAWVKVLHRDTLESDETLATLGPEAWPEPPADLRTVLSGGRPLYTVLRDQRALAGIGRSWVDEILWTAQLSPFKRANELTDENAANLRAAMIEVLARAIEHYEAEVHLPIPDKLPLPLLVHRHQGEPCPRCGTRLEAVNFESYIMSYCPAEQTGGKVLKDRRLSKLLK